MAVFRDRVDAGRKLAQELKQYHGRGDTMVLALPRGGVPVAYEVAAALDLPLDIFLVRKLGVPGHEELAMGAIGSGGTRVLNEEVVEFLDPAAADVERIVAREQEELERRARQYRGDRPEPEFGGKQIILVDDGLATGASMRAAIQGVKAHQPARMIVAVPTAPPETCRALEAEVDEVVCAVTPQPFGGVGLWYENFRQTSDEEVRELLERSMTSTTSGS